MLIPIIYYLRNRKITQINPEIKLSYFLLALKENLISEIIIDNLFILFLGFNSNVWYKTNASVLSKDRIFKLLK